MIDCNQKRLLGILFLGVVLWAQLPPFLVQARDSSVVKGASSVVEFKRLMRSEDARSIIRDFNQTPDAWETLTDNVAEGDADWLQVLGKLRKFLPLDKKDKIQTALLKALLKEPQQILPILDSNPESVLSVKAVCDSPTLADIEKKELVNSLLKIPDNSYNRKKRDDCVEFLQNDDLSTLLAKTVFYDGPVSAIGVLDNKSGAWSDIKKGVASGNTAWLNILATIRDSLPQKRQDEFRKPLVKALVKAPLATLAVFDMRKNGMLNGRNVCSLIGHNKILAADIKRLVAGTHSINTESQRKDCLEALNAILETRKR